MFTSFMPEIFLRVRHKVEGVWTAKMLDCSLEISQFELQLRYYVHLWPNTFRESMKPLIFSALGWIVLLLLLCAYKDNFSIEYPTKGDMLLNK